MKRAIGYFQITIVAGIGMLVIATYMTLNLVYLLPPNPLTQRIKIPVNQFMDQYFAQAWTLFAPNPGFSSTKMIVRCNQSKSEKDWFDPLESLLMQHYQNRFSRASLLVKQYKYIATDLRASIAKTYARCAEFGSACLDWESQVKQSSSFKVAEDFANALCIREAGTSPNEFKILDIYPTPYAERSSGKMISKIVEFSFLTRPNLSNYISRISRDFL